MSQDGGGSVQFPLAAEPQPPDPALASKLKVPTKRKETQAKSKTKVVKPQVEGVEKPKQSKSRNGCLTCKGKRLKCDEVKPTCQQCAKRGVICGGYKKDFKWRPFEETSLGFKGALPTKPKKPDVTSVPAAEHLSPQCASSSDSPEASGSTTKQTSASPPTKYISPITSGGSPPRSIPQLGFDTQNAHGQGLAALQIPHRELEIDLQLPPDSASSLGFPGSQEYGSLEYSPSHFEDLQSSGLNVPALLSNPMPPNGFYPDPELDELDDIEEIVPEHRNRWAMMPSHLVQPFNPENFDYNNIAPLLNQVKLHDDNAEILLSRFVKDTCGILSIRDGPHENPWRTSILPLVHESEALYHALAAVTAFHAASLRPEMKRVGVEHIRCSAQLLARDIQHMRPDIALTLTLVLAFAESWDIHVTTGIKHLQGAKQFLQQALPISQQLGPDHPFSQRIRFLQNTWVYADVIARLTSLDADDSTDFDVAYEADTTAKTDASGNPTIEVDPLMGCAASLFPLIGRVANIVRKVRQTTHGSPPLVSEASEVQAALIQWSPPLCLIQPEDMTCLASDAVRTAEAYRWATLLYLHQAVPELPSLPAPELARNALVQVALVPPKSHTTIVHIYPLLAAGCETLHPADREWVIRRWMAMSQRMLIGNIDRCVEVVREVWTRRDEAQGRRGVARPQTRPESPCWNLAELERLSLSRNDNNGSTLFWTGSLEPSPTISEPSRGGGAFSQHPHSPHTTGWSSAGVEPLPHSKTVRGKLHWIGVMEEWDWEVLLG